MSSSWWNDPLNSDGSLREFKEETARGKAAKYADKVVGTRRLPLWKLVYMAYLAGYLKSQREKFASIRLKVKV